jgi:crossover junction endodeoxyribonuclease RusA
MGMKQASILPPVAPPSGPDLHLVDETAGQVWTFEVVGKPVAQGSMVAFVSKTTGRAMMKPGNEKELYAWRDQVALTAQALRPRWLREAGEGGLDQPVFVSLIFVRARGDDYLADGHTLRKGAARFPATAPDVDKLTRAILDSLTGVAFVNDSRVVSCVAVKRFAERGEAERVIVEIKPL